MREVRKIQIHFLLDYAECPRFIVRIFSAHMNNKPKVTLEVNICGEVIFVLHSFVF